tara:strand:- start:6478 stop:7293 length:816 start_codon:yes stop_codon:yes gene_type:complete
MNMSQSAAPSLSACRAMLAKDGVCVLPRVLDAETTAALRRSLTETAELYRQKGGETFLPYLDPNDRNIRVFNLIGLHPDFRKLILHPTAVSLVEDLLGDGFMISNFTANIALPGSASMALHADQALVAPAPWLEPWAINIIWCLDDANEANGATRYIPGSHLWQSLDDLPDDPMALTRAFEAPAGSIVAMDGRTWHTSGANVTKDKERALLFGYYTQDFIRPQVNWNVLLAPETIAALPADLFNKLGLGPSANSRQGGALLKAMKDRQLQP